VKPSYLIRGFPGHPLHPPLTNATIGLYTGALILAVIAYRMLTLGGWLAGSIVFVHGMRVLNLVDEPRERAVTPGGPDKEMAEGR
jgi:hypothetical protein